MAYLARRHQPGRLTYGSRAAIHIWIHAPPHYHVSQGSRQSPKHTSEGTNGISEQQNAAPSRARRSTRALISHLVAATNVSGLRRSDRANTWCHARCGAWQMAAAGGSSSNALAPPATPTRTVGHVRRSSDLDGATPNQRPAQALRRSAKRKQDYCMIISPPPVKRFF